MGDHWEDLVGFMGKKKLGDFGRQVNFFDRLWRSEFSRSIFEHRPYFRNLLAPLPGWECFGERLTESVFWIFNSNCPHFDDGEHSFLLWSELVRDTLVSLLRI